METIYADEDKSYCNLKSSRIWNYFSDLFKIAKPRLGEELYDNLSEEFINIMNDSMYRLLTHNESRCTFFYEDNTILGSDYKEFKYFLNNRP
eukprot:UN32442